MPPSYRVAGMTVVEHELDVPLDHASPGGATITVFAREVCAEGGADRPYLVFLQGGPGSEAPRPTDLVTPYWLGRALQDYRVLMLDQRGTGRSTPIGSLPGLSPQEQADHLKLHRADSIVRDAEALREHLGVDKWAVLGQSFGGFCVTSYLSVAPESLREAYLTGGLPPLGRPTEEVYRATYARVRERSERYYAKYPDDRARVRRLHELVESEDVRLPSGDRLTVNRLRTLGGMLGMSDGADRLHYILELPHDSRAFLHDVADPMGFDRNPLYAVVHEGCYADGCATRWAAERELPDDFREDRELFTGEMIYPWMFDEYASLAPLRDAAELLAQHEWPALYDADRLAQNEVPAAAAIYANDMYVERAFSEETAAHIRGLHAWVTSEYEHDGLRKDGPRVLGRLVDLARGRI